MAEHRISNKNLRKLTGDCAICGPVKLTGKGGCSIAKQGRKNLVLRRYHFEDGVMLVSPEYYDEVMTNACCQICGQTENLRLDHCHTTGKIRGPLCQRCNTLIGHSLESVEILEAAIAYLRSHAQ